ncbi:PadR family transcriptional regulator [Falsiroseomonas sp.]|uniref:PadR family transcriptional regulator n=1 Tax=Falsiroseomonas sp. TaxID=2870721 RepID=UPI003F72458D
MHHRHHGAGHPHQGHGRRFARGDDATHGHHFGRGHGRMRGGPGGGRSGRLFDHGELRLVVAALVAEQPRHGYELIKEIEDRAAGTYSPSPGVIYPTLTMLEELGHATVAEGAGKKLYAITEEGRAWLAANQPAVDAALARMQAVRAAHGGPRPELMRATENLKLALRLRLARGPLDAAQLRSITEALDAAALAIERS